MALKKIKKKAVKDISQLITSIKIHLLLKQPNLVELYGLFHDKEHLYLLMELCVDDSLKTMKKSINSKGIK